MNIISRSEWGAHPPRSTNKDRKAEGIVIHHSATGNRPTGMPVEFELPRSALVLRNIQENHMQRGWVDIGYNFFISRGGLIFEGRAGSAEKSEAGYVVQGAHSGSKQINATMFGVCLEGTFRDPSCITAEEWNAVVELCGWMAWLGDFDTSKIWGHNYFKSTACPGALQIPLLRKEAHDRKVALEKESQEKVRHTAGGNRR